MNITIKLDRKEAQRIIGDAILKTVLTQANVCSFRIESVDWNAYGTRIEIAVTDEPESAI